jgi:hypothetical protein
MSKTYVTFGQDHAHTIAGKIFNKDCVAVINCADREDGRRIAFECFGPKFCFEYHEKEFSQESLRFFPRGLIELNPG